MEVKQNLIKYQKLLMKLQLQHQTYLNKLSLIKGKEGYTQEIEAYIDEVLYDKGRLKDNVKKSKYKEILCWIS